MPTLPVMLLLSAAFRLMLGNFRLLARMLATPVLITMVAAGLLAALAGLDGIRPLRFGTPGADGTMVITGTEAAELRMRAVALLALVLFSLVAMAPFLTAWHRLLHAGPRATAEDLAYRFRPPEVRYAFALVLFLFLGMFAAAMLFFVLLAAFGDRLGGGGLIMALLLSFMPPAAIFLRLAVALPAMAMGRTGFGPAMAWDATRGHTWPLLAAVALSQVPVVLLKWALAMLVIRIEPNFAYGVTKAMFVEGAMFCTSALSFALVATILSLAYSRLAGRSAAGGSAPGGLTEIGDR